ncbi:hypothetical protein BEP19_06485 [Ammoniphilus oxalaticus]|uniref:S1 motif domain-containing protein n=1 Tax=Ammoniphilus oxalaticus TaxID=66863 RepID=A0A419SL11_9BACL|nr:S1 RNA-binding domain-containing protein [Ammoniphilus oxalaticus]RKD24675.1 hypothetical protein BEP19_06485 [Ammoniphilus oxalaticus]
MSNQISVGDTLKGKVTGIKKYGAFVLLPSGRSGLVHISQIAREYVKQVEDYLTVGDDVEVKVIAMEGHKISLSIKELRPLSRKDGQQSTSGVNRRSDGRQTSQGPRPSREPSEKDKMDSLEEKLKKWMKASEERLQQLQSKQKRR